MKSKIEHELYNTKMETSDWRYSASIVGLIKYFDYLVSKGYGLQSELYKIDNDVIRYDSNKITVENYLLFVETYYESAMHHRDVEKILEESELTDEQIKLVNDKLKANSIMKNTFKGISYENANRELILDLIEKNRLILIKETYRRGRSLYINYCNEKFNTSKKLN